MDKKHRYELIKCQELVNFLNKKGFNIKHKIIDLTSISELLNSSLVGDNSVIHPGRYSLENMKGTVVPNRNKIFSSIIQAAAAIHE